MKHLLGLCLVAFASIANAEMDSQSRDLLIQKLNKVNLTLAPSDSSKVAVTLRLADLLAERARIAAMKDLESGCTVCTAGQEDREKALRLYKDVVDRVPLAQKGKVYIQLGHLAELTGHEKEALVYYEKVRNESQDPASLAESSLSMAEMLFKKNQFQKAKSAYEEVLKIPQASSKGLAAYRSAWCSFNMGEPQKAISELTHILETPALLTRNGLASNQVDPQFQEEVSRDLATFMSKHSIGQADIDRLYRLSPEVTKVSNVTLLASEAERVGRRKEALQVWNFVYAHETEPSARLEVLAHRAPLYLENSEKDLALTDLESAKELWKEQKGCGKKDCAEIQKSLRGFIVNWNQSEKKSPSPELSKAYGYYLEVFPDDVQMNLWAAQVSKSLKEYDLAMVRQKNAALVLIKGADISELESALLGAVEISEASQNDQFIASAQDFYLSASKKKTKVYEIQYQKAHKLYELGQYEKAANELRDLALNKSGPSQLRKQSADLALDAVGILKDETKLIAWAKEFAAGDKNNAADYEKVAQKAVLSKSAAMANEKPTEALVALQNFDAGKAEAGDRLIYLKNKLILAERVGQYMVARNAADDILALKDLKQEDREFALSRKAWIAELQLDFETALNAAQKMEMKGLGADIKALRLAIYSDLSGKSAKGFYEQYLKTTTDADAKAQVAAEMVRRSQDPMAEIEKQKSILSKAPDLLARLYVESFSKTLSEKILDKATKDTLIAKSDWGRLLSRVKVLKEYEALRVKVAAHQLNSTNQKTLGKSIKERAALLTKAEEIAATGISLGDWTSQLVSIDLVAKESGRFYQELMSLPMPEGLSPEEESEYMNLLGQQASPFKTKADQAAAKVVEFWARPSWKSDLARSIETGAEFRGLMARELTSLKNAASTADQQYLSELEYKNAAVLSLPNLKEIEIAKDELRKAPLNTSAVQRLLDLERKTKNFAMIQYLEGRLKAMETQEVKK